MAAPRAEIPVVVLSESTPVSYVPGATVYIKNRATETLSTVFANSGASEEAITQPLSTDSLGRVTGWLPRGGYKLEITIPGKSAYVENLDIVPGSDGSIDTELLASESVTLAKIAASAKNAAAGTSSLRSLGTSSTQAAAGNDARLSDTRIPTDGSVTTTKVADGAITNAKMAAGSGFIPTGGILPFAGSAAPTGFLLCNGASVVKASFEPLFSVTGYTYGGSGSNFNVPDLRGRVPVGEDSGGLRIAANVLRGQSAGHYYLQSHSHGSGGLSTQAGIWQPQQVLAGFYNQYTASPPGFIAVSGWNNPLQQINGNTASEGSGSGQNMPPYLIINYIIKT